MIIDNLTKFNQKKKLWMTPKHPLYGKSVDYKIIYGAVVFMQAEINCLSSPLNNFELERLLISGFGLDSDGMSQVLRLSKEKSIVIDKLMRAFASDREKYLLMLDLMNVSLRDMEIQEKEQESIQLFSKMFGVSQEELSMLEEFAFGAQEENVPKCREILHRMHVQNMDLPPVDMKYYIMRLWETMECTQEILEEQREVRIVERCLSPE